MSTQHKRLNNIAQEQGSSSWLTVLPIKQFGFSLWKAEFWDAVYLGYELPLNNFQVSAVVQKFTVQHALSYKKGGFVTLRHNELCDNIAEMLQEDTNAVRIEPILQPLTAQEQSIGGNVSVEAWADVSARVFWCRGQRAFFDVRFFDLNAQGHENKTFKRCYELNEYKKKRDYSSRIFNVEQGSLIPLVFLITSSMRRDCARWSH